MLENRTIELSFICVYIDTNAPSFIPNDMDSCITKKL